MKRRSLSALLSAAILCSLLPVTACAATTWDTANATTLTFSDTAISADKEDGYKTEGTALTIQEAGTYVVTGSCSDGSIKIKKGTTDVVLILDNLDLTSADTAPISCNKSTEVTIVAAEGSDNTLRDSAQNNEEDCPDNENAENAVIKCKDGSQVTLAGTGSLTLHANAKNGIKSGATTEEEGEAWLVIQDLTLTIDCPANDAINAEQSLSIPSGTITVSAGDDGIHSDYDLTIGATGTVGPAITVTESYEALEASHITVYSGTLNLHSSDDGMNAANSDLKGDAFSIAVSGGTIYVDAETGDGLDSNGTLTISGGTLSVFSASSGDNQPLDSDGVFTLSGGTVLAVGSSGMGMKLTATQPCVTFGSTAQMGGGQRPGGQGGNMGQPDAMAKPDDTQQPGGQMAKPNDTQQPGGQMAKPDDTQQPGGQMAKPDDTQQPDEQRIQPGGQRPDGQQDGMEQKEAMGQGGGNQLISAGSTLTVQDDSGNTLCTATAVRSAGYVFFSSSKLTAGNTYTLCGNGTALGTATAATESSGTPTGGGQQGNNQQSGHRFTDVSKTDWYYDAVSYVVGKNLMNGTSETSFDPDGETTRGMLVTILYRLEGSPATTGTCPFSDVKEEDYYAEAVRWACENSIVNGTGETTFSPNTALTREQLATILYRYANWKGLDVTGQSDLSGYDDRNSISEYAKKAMGWANQVGLVNGISETKISPATASTRVQVATILMRFCENL